MGNVKRDCWLKGLDCDAKDITTAQVLRFGQISKLMTEKLITARNLLYWWMQYKMNHGWERLLMKARFTQFLRGEFIVYLSLCNP